MKKVTCKKVLVDYINTHSGWHHKVDLYVVAREWSPETAGRALRNAEKSGLIKVDYYNSKYAKNLAKYASLELQPAPKTKITFEERDGVMVAVVHTLEACL